MLEACPISRPLHPERLLAFQEGQEGPRSLNTIHTHIKPRKDIPPTCADTEIFLDRVKERNLLIFSMTLSRSHPTLKATSRSDIDSRTLHDEIAGTVWRDNRERSYLGNSLRHVKKTRKLLENVASLCKNMSGVGQADGNGPEVMCGHVHTLLTIRISTNSLQ